MTQHGTPRHTEPSRARSNRGYGRGRGEHRTTRGRCGACGRGSVGKFRSSSLTISERPAYCDGLVPSGSRAHLLRNRSFSRQTLLPPQTRCRGNLRRPRSLNRRVHRAELAIDCVVRRGAQPRDLADSSGHSDTDLSSKPANTSTGVCHPSVLRGRPLSCRGILARAFARRASAAPPVWWGGIG